jgi:heme/copper-type cytochrome/quinol oxidase subunit 2
MVAPVFARQSMKVMAGVALLSAVAATSGGASGTAGFTRLSGAATRQETAPTRREFTIVGRRCAFSPDRIEVRQDDLVKITLVAEDIPHSFTIDPPYRIAKRAAPERPVTFEFRADRPGTFEFYCNLTTDEGCRRMRGDLVVTPR